MVIVMTKIEIARNRHSIRLCEYDYSQAGAYFVTVCSWERECRFGNVEGGDIRLNRLGEIVRDEWLRTAEIRMEIELGEYVVMPNHLHGIILITDTVGAHGVRPSEVEIDRIPKESTRRTEMGQTPTGRTPCAPTMNRKPKSLGALIAGFKSSVTKRINILRDKPGGPMWQRNYYEHVIRDEADYRRIADYITHNPLRWTEDSLHPTASP